MCRPFARDNLDPVWESSVDPVCAGDVASLSLPDSENKLSNLNIAFQENKAAHGKDITPLALVNLKLLHLLL